MTKVCLIPPVLDLERFVPTDFFDHHLALTHLVHEHESYSRFYRSRADSGHYVILDNSAKEYGAGANMREVLRCAIEIGAKEVVLSDVRFKARDTLDLGRRELEWLESFEGRCMYEAAGFPRLMIVPQGTNPDEWLKCMNTLIDMTIGCLYRVDSKYRNPVVAVPYHYDHIFECGILPLVGMVPPWLEVHLLGWTRRLQSLRDITETFPGRCRSVDSSRPFVYAMKNLPASDEVQYPTRGEHYFQSKVPGEATDTAWLNVAHFQYCAGVPALYKPAA